MARTVKGGLIQASNPIPGDKDLQKIKQAMLDKHIPLIEQAGQPGRRGLVLCKKSSTDPTSAPRKTVAGTPPLSPSLTAKPPR